MIKIYSFFTQTQRSDLSRREQTRFFFTQLITIKNRILEEHQKSQWLYFLSPTCKILQVINCSHCSGGGRKKSRDS